MKFLQLSLMLGIALILGPIAHHAYYISQFANIVPAVMNSQGNLNFPELPQMSYAISGAAGVLLTAVSMFFGIKMVLAELRAGRIGAAA